MRENNPNPQARTDHARPLAAVMPAMLFLIVVPILAHRFFSWIGYNPTDDGFILAYSRRLLLGQIPHRDFITIRPALSPILHMPVVAFGGSHTFAVSRLIVWFEFAAIAWCWASIIDRLLGLRLGAGRRLIMAAVAFVFSVHSFPIMAWHTIDALFLVSLGLSLCVVTLPNVSLLGIVLISASYLCKQNFLLVAPVAIIALGKRRSARHWIAAAAPGAAYLVFLLGTGALPDALVQMTSQVGLLRTGLLSYLSCGPFLIAVPLGYFGSRCLSVPRRRGLGMVMLLLVLLYAIITLWIGRYSSKPAMAVFGAVLGATLHFARARLGSKLPMHTTGLLALATAWSASISLGYNTPALASGPLVALVMAFVWLSGDAAKRSRRESVMLAALALLSIAAFVHVRLQFPYRDAPAEHLRCSLGDALAGGKGIRTNAYTHSCLSDLHRLTRTLPKHSYCIVPDTAGWWVEPGHANPLPIDWVISTELNKRALRQRVIDRLIAGGDELSIIVERYDPGQLAGGAKRPNNEWVVRYVRAHYIRRLETPWFEMYRGRTR